MWGTSVTKCVQSLFKTYVQIPDGNWLLMASDRIVFGKKLWHIKNLKNIKKIALFPTTGCYQYVSWFSSFFVAMQRYLCKQQISPKSQVFHSISFDFTISLVESKSFFPASEWIRLSFSLSLTHTHTLSLSLSLSLSRPLARSLAQIREACLESGKNSSRCL